MNKYYEILMQFDIGVPVTRFSLIHRFPEQLVDEIIEKGYIVYFDQSQFDEPRYIITKLGLEVRDK